MIFRKEWGGLKPKQIFYLLFTSCVSNTLYSQGGTSQPDPSNFTKLIEVIPPSPHAASLGKYGGINTGLSSGMVSVNIPLFNYSSSNIKLPVVLDYSSTGFKVDEISSRTGTGWTLNSGGVITRTVYGSIDEQSIRLVKTA